MSRYVIRRLLQAIPLLFLFTWLAGRLFGGNGPVRPDPAAEETPERPPDA